MNPRLPTSAFPSGHEAATCCVWIAVAILVIGHTHGWWRWLFLAPAIVMPILVAVSRMYRGEHHPTDILGSLVFSGQWIAAAYLLIKPNAGSRNPDIIDRSPMTEPASVRQPDAKAAASAMSTAPGGTAEDAGASTTGNSNEASKHEIPGRWQH